MNLSCIHNKKLIVLVFFICILVLCPSQDIQASVSRKQVESYYNRFVRAMTSNIRWAGSQSYSVIPIYGKDDIQTDPVLDRMSALLNRELTSSRLTLVSRERRDRIVNTLSDSFLSYIRILFPPPREKLQGTQIS